MLGISEENAYINRMKVAGQEEINQYEMQGYGHNMTNPAFPLLLDNILAHRMNEIA